jgi:maleylacetoacetate isomerase
MSLKTCLFSSWRSSCSYRVRTALNIKQIQHEIKPVNLIKLAETTTKTDNDAAGDYKLNPMQYIPALQIDGHTLIESMSIINYLEETRPEPSLLPKDFHKRAQVRAICDIIVSGIQPLQNIGVLNHMGHYLGENEKKWSQHWIIKGFTALEKILENCSGKYCVGDEITMADCCLVPQVYNARR